MVDDRYGWLDEDVAERLLRGEPLDFADGSGRRGRHRRWSPEDRAAAERLAAVLARVAESGRPGENGRVPGEQAALAAFRAAQESTSRASATEFAAESPFGGRRERNRSGVVQRLRSLRLSVVGAVAACALGGVAVASGTGVLPAPSFIPDSGGNRSPSVGATTSAETPGGGDGDRKGSVAENGKGSDKDGKGKDSGAGGKDTKGAGGSIGTDPDLPGRGVIGDVNGQQPPNDPDTEAVLDEMCRDYLAAQAGTGPMPGQGRLRVLEQAAGGPEAVASFCSNRLDVKAGTPGGTTGDGTGGGDADGGTEEPGSPSPTNPTSPGTDPGGSDGSDGGTDGGDTDGSDGEEGGDPSSSPSLGMSESPSAPAPTATSTQSAATPTESGSAPG